MNSDKGAVSNGEMINQDFIDPDKQPTKRYRSAGSMNMRGVFLHVLADALGSIIVIISALIVHYTDWSYNVYVDPILSIIMVSLIFYSTLPLCKFLKSI